MLPLRDSEEDLDRVAMGAVSEKEFNMGPDLVLCSDGLPERLAIARFQEELVLSSLGCGFMRIGEEIGTRLGKIPHGWFRQADGESGGSSW